MDNRAKGALLQAPVKFLNCCEKIPGNLKERVQCTAVEKANWLRNTGEGRVRAKGRSSQV